MPAQSHANNAHNDVVIADTKHWQCVKDIRHALLRQATNF